MVRILHLTDFHLNQRTLKDWKSYVREAFLDKIRILEKKNPIDFIAFTGDLIDMGGDDFDSIQIAFETFKIEVIDYIIDNVGFAPGKFLIVPGNHDINRKLDSKRDEAGSFSHFNEKHEHISEFMLDAIKNSSYDGMKRIKDYKDFEFKLYEGIKDYQFSIFGSSYKFRTQEYHIGVSCLNSSWRCFGKNDFGRLIVGEDQLSPNFKYIMDCDIKVALMHHPLDWLLESERGTITNHLSKDFDILLTGHVHSNRTSIVSGFTGTLFKNLAPSGLNDIRSDSKTYANGFTVVDFDKKNNCITCTYWKYNHDQKGFVLNTDVTDEGKFECLIPTHKSKKNIIIESEIIDNIKEDHFLEMDGHLIEAKVNSPKLSIKEGFIFPPISEGLSSEIEADQVNDITLEEIMKMKSNLMFFGNQESGKTTLLFRIVRQFIDEYSYLQTIPVYVDFVELGNKEFSTVIKEYLRCNSEDVTRLLKENKLVLVIDNLNFRMHLHPHQRNKLVKLNKEYEDLRIIAAGENLTAGILPMEYIELCKIPFRNYFIKNLGAREIKSIMRIWLPNETDLNSDLKLDKLVSTFNSYALPSSAMSVSLFLWSTEYSDRKPINNAVLMEIYIEILLQKLGKHNIYRDSFDFTNKVQLLAKIAHEMFKKNEPNYSLLFSEFQSIVEKYLLEEVSFDFDASVIVNYFIERKIFVKHHQNRVKFSYSCFFHFFLAKRMIFSTSFKDDIMKEEEYYKHHKEIDYYTGLTRSDEEFLQLIYDRFEKKFKETDVVYDTIDFDKYLTETTIEQGKEHVPIIKDLDEKKIRDNRPTPEMMEAFYNERLSRTPNPGEIHKNEGAVTFEQLLIIMANVLRNSEGVENKALKSRAYRLQVKYSLTWLVLYRESLIRYVIEHKKLPPSLPYNINFAAFIKAFAVSVQSGMNNHLGTIKLAPIILEKVEEDLISKSISDLEAFFSVLLYSDIQGTDFPTYLRKFIKKIKKNVVRDYTLMKLLDYYYRRTRPKGSNEEMYLDFISDLRIKTQKLPQRMKSKIIKSIKDAKKAFDNGQS